jgi:ribonuclease Z
MSDLIKWTVLGSSAGNVSPTYNSSGYLLEVGDSRILFDCGSGVCSATKRLDYSPVDISHIFITHMHSDHTCELPLFVQMRYTNKEPGALEIWMPSEGTEAFEKWLSTGYLFKEKLPFNLMINPVRGEIRLEHPDIKIIPIPNNHLKDSAEYIKKYHYPNWMESYSYRIETPEKDILYSGDLWSIDDIEEHLKKLDLLVVESMHIDLSTLPDLVEKYRVGKVLLTHIADADRERVADFAEKAGSGRFMVASDSLVITL